MEASSRQEVLKGLPSKLRQERTVSRLCSRVADAERYDAVLLQEPWTAVRGSHCLTKTHPAYDTYSPVDSWDGTSTRPRVMTYIRRGAGLLADQKRPTSTRDILWLTVNSITLVNFYRQPHYDVALEIYLAGPYLIGASLQEASTPNTTHGTLAGWKGAGTTSPRGQPRMILASSTPPTSLLTLMATPLALPSPTLPSPRRP